MVIKKTTKAYFAGFFDGDGSVTICKREGRKTNHSATHYMLVQITNGVKEPLDLVSKIFGGSYHPVKTSTGRAWKWALTGEKARIFLEDMYPYLIVRKSAVKLALEFQKTCVRKKFPIRVATPKWLIKKRDAYKERLILLNKAKYSN